MKKQLAYLSLLGMMFVSTSVQALEVKGQVSHQYEGGLFSSSPSDEDKVEAVKAAKLAALKQYVSTFNVSKQQQYSKIEDEVVKNIDDYISSYTIVAEDVNENLKLLNLVIRADINENKINAQLKGTTTAGTMASGDGSAFSFMFVAREITESKVFKTRDTTISQGEQEHDARQHVSGSGINESVSNYSKTTSGGNIVRKTSQEKYRTLATTDFDAAFNEVLTGMGYETVDYADVLSNCGGASISSIKNAFATSDELPQNLRNKAIKGAKSCDVKYFAVGYMNVSVPELDPVSGEQKVIVSINGMVWNIDKKLPRKVASVGPVQYFGLGPDKDTARRNALRLAAKSAAETVSNQLGNKDLY